MKMREILFHGKRADNGEWVEGILFNAEEDTFIIPHGNEYSYDPMEGLAFDVYGCKVAPETVGQYTGLTDRNGKKIFEGDIVTGWFNHEKIVGYIFYGGNARFFIQRDGIYGIGLDNASNWLEVIGNINDNPELLGEEDT